MVFYSDDVYMKMEHSARNRQPLVHYSMVTCTVRTRDLVYVVAQTASPVSACLFDGRTWNLPEDEDTTSVDSERQRRSIQSSAGLGVIARQLQRKAPGHSVSTPVLRMRKIAQKKYLPIKQSWKDK